MFNTNVGAEAVGAGAASRYGSGSDQKMRLLAAPAPNTEFYIMMNESIHSMLFNLYVINKRFDAGVVGDGSRAVDALCYDSGSAKNMQLLAAPSCVVCLNF
jgi:hypothetical protein